MVSWYAVENAHTWTLPEYKEVSLVVTYSLTWHCSSFDLGQSKVCLLTPGTGDLRCSAFVVISLSLSSKVKCSAVIIFYSLYCVFLILS